MRLALKVSIIALFLLSWAPFFVFAHTVDEENTAVIHMTGEGFLPEEVTIEQGGTVIFENEDTRGHWPASNIHSTHTVYPGSNITKCETDEAGTIFDACRGLKQGETYSFQFNKAGEWRFHDHLLPQLTGKIIVLEDPDFVDPDKEEENVLSKKLLNFFHNLRLSIVRIYYRVFPSALEKRLQDTHIFDIANDEAQLYEALELAGPRVIMDKLLEEAGGGAELDCHQEAHQVGRVAYEVYGGKVFEEGDPSCHSGFYHGAMEAFLSEKGTNNLGVNISELCNTFPTIFGIFECLHGVGHGVMAYEDYDLPEALSTCEELDSDFATRSCYGGVFMENVVTGQGFGAIPGHETTWLSNDPHFPCSAVGPDYGRRFECYQMQTSWMLTLTNYDFSLVAKGCERATVDMREPCFVSLGRDAAGYTLRNPQRILELCAYAPKENNYYERCIYGAENVVIDFWGPKLENQAREFCALVPEQAVQDSCFDTLQRREKEIFGDNISAL